MINEVMIDATMMRLFIRRDIMAHTINASPILRLYFSVKAQTDKLEIMDKLISSFAIFLKLSSFLGCGR
jgi:hypothetical protein